MNFNWKIVALIVFLIAIVLLITLIKMNNKSETKEQIENAENLETITLAGGCFWCIEAYFQNVEGVVSAISGYAGGEEDDANYLKVAAGDTKHREAVQVIYDPKKITTREVIEDFWTQIDPTQKDGQFADKGTQYTTAIYYHDDAQKMIAEESKKSLEESGLIEGEVATEILPFTTFFIAEEYHQDYYQKATDHYEAYKKASGRAGFIEDTWARDAAKKYFEEQKSKGNAKGDYEYTEEEIAELLKNLDPLEYHVIAEDGTEQPFANAYWDNKADGIYVDKLTGEPLFSSTHKYDSGTGWPSFWRTIDDDSVTLKDDNSIAFMPRTEIENNGAHIGHVFEDGPKDKGGQRFCTNSASLLFIPKEEMEEKGYGKYLNLFE
jgi:peptide methionine sulfoxide reductase msrA/msrB